VTKDIERISHLLRSEHPAILIVTYEEADARRAVRAAAVDRLRHTYFEWTATRGVYDATFDDEGASVRDTENAAAGLFHLARTVHTDCTVTLFDLAGHLEDARTLRAYRELVRRMSEVGGTVVLIDHADTLPDVVKSETTSYELSLPDQAAIRNIVKQKLREMHRRREIDVRLTRKNLDTIVRNLSGLPRRHCEQIIAETVATDGVIDADDINHVMAQKRKLLHKDGLLDYVEAPVDLRDIGGLGALKDWLDKRKNAFGDDAADYGLPAPRGVLMLGVQGAGKSLCAKAIATGWQRPLLRLDPGTLYNSYIGESERRLREALQQAEMMAPLVLWIDEIEKGFASAASRSNDGGLSQRMFGTLLTWMQEHEAPVFMVATANDIEALPPELLRKGRFDEIFFVDLPKKSTRKKIFEIHLRKRNRDPKQFDLNALAETSDGYSGAEIEQAVVSGLHESFSSSEDLTTDMILRALENSPPLSVTMAEKIAALRRWAEGRCVPAE